MGYIYYYDNVRGHSSLSYQTPFAYLKWQLPDLDDKIRFVIPIMLDKVSVELGTWSGYHVLAQHLLRNEKGAPEEAPTLCNFNFNRASSLANLPPKQLTKQPCGSGYVKSSNEFGGAVQLKPDNIGNTKPNRLVVVNTRHKTFAPQSAS